MKWWQAVLLICFAAGALAAEHGEMSSIKPAAQITGTVAAETSLVHILSPVPNQQLSTSYVDVNYELVNRGVDGGSPNFQIQLDARDPVNSSDTTYTFIGLTPGKHTLTVQLVDANGTPIAGGRSMVVFLVVAGSAQQGARPSDSTAGSSEPPDIAPASSAGSSFLSRAELIASSIWDSDFPARASRVLAMTRGRYVRTAGGLKQIGPRILGFQNTGSPNPAVHERSTIHRKPFVPLAAVLYPSRSRTITSALSAMLFGAALLARATSALRSAIKY